MSPTERAYPLARPDDDDPRFTIGLLIDVASVLRQHGYPPLVDGDLISLQQALFGFLYARPAAGGQP